VSAYPGKKIQIHRFIAALVENKPKYINNHFQMYKNKYNRQLHDLCKLRKRFEGYNERFNIILQPRWFKISN
jgi:hypothetical protein